MNDPNTPADGLLEAIEEEYLELAAAGDFKALDYALAESDEFCISVHTTITGLMRAAGPESSRDPASSDTVLSIWAQGVRADLLAVLTEHVAPAWALAEYPKRVEATAEMVAEWRFQETYCSQCGNACGPGNEGFSDCRQHYIRRAAEWQKEAGEAA